VFIHLTLPQFHKKYFMTCSTISKQAGLLFYLRSPKRMQTSYDHIASALTILSTTSTSSEWEVLLSHIPLTITNKLIESHFTKYGAVKKIETINFCEFGYRDVVLAFENHDHAIRAVFGFNNDGDGKCEESFRGIRATLHQGLLKKKPIVVEDDNFANGALQDEDFMDTNDRQRVYEELERRQAAIVSRLMAPGAKTHKLPKMAFVVTRDYTKPNSKNDFIVHACTVDDKAYVSFGFEALNNCYLCMARIFFTTIQIKRHVEDLLLQTPHDPNAPSSHNPTFKIPSTLKSRVVMPTK
jgi:hypothetical protein